MSVFHPLRIFATAACAGEDEPQAGRRGGGTRRYRDGNFAVACARHPRCLPAAARQEARHMRAFIFPGQGSQSVGMGKALAEASSAAREVFQEVDEALKQSLSRLMAEGPQDELTLTENAQPAIMANSIATLRAAGVDVAAKAAFVAGHSLGEYSAVCAAGAFDLATTARLLKLRGRAMQAAVPVGEGAMAALLGANLQVAQSVAEAEIGRAH